MDCAGCVIKESRCVTKVEIVVSLLALERWGSCKYAGHSSPTATAEVCLRIIPVTAASEANTNISKAKSLIQRTFERGVLVAPLCKTGIIAVNPPFTTVYSR